MAKTQAVAKSENDPSIALTKIRRAAGLDSERWTNERISAIKSLCAPRAKSVHELAMFLATVERYDLDPMQGEAWLAQMDGNATVVVGRDGYLKIAGKDPDFLGFQADVVHEGDDYVMERKGDRVFVHHRKTGFDRGEIAGAYAVIRRRGKADVSFEMPWAELKHLHGQQTYKRHPSQMLLTRALTFALKLTYNLSGVYSSADVELERAFDEAGIGTDDVESASVAEKTKTKLEALTERVRGEMEQEGPGVSDEAEKSDDPGDDGIVDAEFDFVDDDDDDDDDPAELTHEEADRLAAEEEGAPALPFD